jgi:MFS family permease
MKVVLKKLDAIQKKIFSKTTTVMSLYYFGVFLFVPFLAPYVSKLGLDKFQIGLIFAMYPFMSKLASPFVGAISDSVGKYRIILFGLILEIIAITLYIFDKSWWVFLLGRAIDAIAFCAVILVGISFVEENLHKHNRGTYAGWSLSMIHLGKLLGPIIGGLLADYYYIKMPFYVGGAVTVLLLILFIIFYKKDEKKTEERKKLTWQSLNILAQFAWFLRRPNLRGMALLGIIMHATLPLFSIFIPLLIVENMGLSYKYVGIAIFAMELPQLFQFIYGKVADKIPRHQAVIFGTGLYGVAILLLYFAPAYWVLVSVMLLIGIGLGFWNVGAWSLMSDVGCEHGNIGSVSGCYASIARAGEIVSSVLSGLIALKLGTDALILGNGALVIVGSILSYFLIKDMAAQ